MSAARRRLGEMGGFVFDLDGCVWTGEVLVPGAADVLALLRKRGRRVSFLTNNSRARSLSSCIANNATINSTPSVPCSCLS